MIRSFTRRRLAANFPTLDDVRRFFQELRGPARRSAARGFLDAVGVSLTLKRRGFAPLMTEPSRDSLRVDPYAARRIAASVDTAFGVLPLAATCLRRSVVLKRELSRRGLESTLHIGVRQSNGAVEAHAWIQVRDEVVNDDPDLTETYAEIATGDLDRLFPALS